MGLERLTRVLRERRPELLREELVGMLIAGEEDWLRDERDLMVALAPYHHCAAQLQLDVPAVFDAAASAGPATVHGTVTEFGRRTDVSPEAFGFVLEWDEDGPRYVTAGPSGAETSELLRRGGYSIQTTCEISKAVICRVRHLHTAGSRRGYFGKPKLEFG